MAGHRRAPRTISATRPDGCTPRSSRPTFPRAQVTARAAARLRQRLPLGEEHLINVFSRAARAVFPGLSTHVDRRRSASAGGTSFCRAPGRRCSRSPLDRADARGKRPGSARLGLRHARGAHRQTRPRRQSSSLPTRPSGTLNRDPRARSAWSSNGRTPHFGCGYPGSNPGRAAPFRPGRAVTSTAHESVNTQADVGEPPRTGALVAVVLAAGQGTRMRSRHHKVLHLLGGKPLIQRVLDLLARRRRHAASWSCSDTRPTRSARCCPNRSTPSSRSRSWARATPSRSPPSACSARRRTTAGALRRRGAGAPRQPAAARSPPTSARRADRIAERARARPARLRAGHPSGRTAASISMVEEVDATPEQRADRRDLERLDARVHAVAVAEPGQTAAERQG